MSIRRARAHCTQAKLESRQRSCLKRSTSTPRSSERPIQPWNISRANIGMVMENKQRGTRVILNFDHLSKNETAWVVSSEVIKWAWPRKRWMHKNWEPSSAISNRFLRLSRLPVRTCQGRKIINRSRALSTYNNSHLRHWQDLIKCLLLGLQPIRQLRIHLLTIYPKPSTVANS